MTDQVFAREISPGLWQWASCDDHGQWQDDAYQSGDSEALASQLSANTPVSIVLRGQHVVATEVSIDAKQRKHAAKLIPYELEDELSSSVDDLHFSFVHLEDATSVLYVDKEQCISSINDISEQGCDVNTALPDYLLLDREEGEIIILLEAGILSLRASEHWGFSVEQELASLLLNRIAEHSGFAENPPEKIKLVSGSEQEIKQLLRLLPESWRDIERSGMIGDFWDCVNASHAVSGLNLRRGALSRQLPFDQWWKFWKFPAIVFAVAFICAVVVNLGGYFAAKSEEKTVREEINTVYLNAVPNGRLGDVEGILESKLKTVRKTKAEPSNFAFILGKTITALGKDSGVKVTSFSYNGDQSMLQLVIEFASLDMLAKFRAKLTELGIESDSPPTTSIGDGYQARMKLREST